MPARISRALLSLRLAVPLIAALAAISLPGWEHGPEHAHAAAFVVNSNTDDPDAVPGDGLCSNLGGVCTLRAALQELNAAGAGDVINFQANYVIQPSSPLPSINVDSVTINGLAPSGRVTLDGQFAGMTANGLVLNSSFNDITGLAISRFQLAGIRIEAGAAESTIANNRIGTNTLGTAAAANGVGVHIAGNDNTLGGSSTLLRNIVSGNNGHGVVIDASSGNQVMGNYIGTNAAGTAAVGNGGSGVTLVNASSNSVGAMGSGNVISGNAQDGVSLTQGGGTNDGNVVAGNLIGTNAAGDAAIANGSDGVQTQGVIANVTIGGTSSGERNVISGNLGHGVSHKGSGGANVSVIGNYIGTSLDGMADLGNGTSGVYSEGNNLTIGGTAAGAGNVISGNSMHGIHAELRTIKVFGNIIGLGSDGATALGNGQHGVLIHHTQSYSEIGSATGSGRNVISANSIHGVSLVGDPMNATFPATAAIFNNYIGTDVTGAMDRGNGGDGLLIVTSDGNSIGTSFGQRNVVSGNTGSGVNISQSSGNNLYENYIGTNAAGTADLGNDGYGVAIDRGSANNIGSVNGAAHSLISGNDNAGVGLLDTTGNKIRNVYLGTNYAGTAAIPNEFGVAMDAATSNVIGGPNPGEGNLISGNVFDGVNLGGASNAVQGNRIGTTADGAGAVPNGRFGIDLVSGQGQTIGSFTSTTRNVISGNTSDGIRIGGGGTENSTVTGNFIGVDITGATRLANGGAGVLLTGAASIQIGSAAAGGANVISGNVGPGVYLTNSSTAVTVLGNIIGPRADGLSALAAGTGPYGVLVANSAHDNIIGSLVASSGNQIAYHTGDGIRIQGAATLNNVVLGNSIHSNAFKGIDTFDGGNGEPAPVVTSFNAGGASGTSTCATCRISVYSDGGDEGRNYHGETTTNGGGGWTFVGAISGSNATATVEFPNGNTSEFSFTGDTDGDGCSDIEENGTNEIFGGDRDPNDKWDFFNVTSDKAIDLSDTLEILDHFGALPMQPNYDEKYDRYAPIVGMPWRTAKATGNHLGINLQDALVNLQSFGHNCSAPP